MQGDPTSEAYLLLQRALGDWWKDDRRRWCAYCGIPMRLRTPKGVQVPGTASTRDHVISRKHRGGLVTIPACRSCNTAKGAMSLQEFLLTDYFREQRRNRHRNQWPMDRLWLIASFAALKRSIALSSAVATK